MLIISLQIIVFNLAAIYTFKDKELFKTIWYIDYGMSYFLLMTSE